MGVIVLRVCPTACRGAGEAAMLCYKLQVAESRTICAATFQDYSRIEALLRRSLIAVAMVLAVW